MKRLFLMLIVLMIVVNAHGQSSLEKVNVDSGIVSNTHDTFAPKAMDKCLEIQKWYVENYTKLIERISKDSFPENLLIKCLDSENSIYSYRASHMLFSLRSDIIKALPYFFIKKLYILSLNCMAPELDETCKSGSSDMPYYGRSTRSIIDYWYRYRLDEMSALESNSMTPQVLCK